MKKLLILVSVIGGLALATAATAGPEHPEHKRGKKPIHHLVKALHHIGIDEDQKAEIKSILSDMRTELKPIMEAMHENKQTLHEVVSSQPLNESTVSQLANAQADLTREKIEITSRYMSSVYGQLSEEQIQELQALKAKRKAMRAERRSRR